jgi:hypothetical protein
MIIVIGCVDEYLFGGLGSISMVEMVGITDIAKRLKVEETTVRRFIARQSDELGIQLHKVKGNKQALSREHADRIIAAYEATRRGPIQPDVDNADKYDRFGFFYLIQLVPEALPNRVKIGFADDFDKRLGEHRTAAPTAKLLKVWPCKRSWDYAAMDSITREECKLVLNEVYESDIAGFIARGDAFFAVMPSPDSERELSQYSPLYELTGSTFEERSNQTLHVPGTAIPVSQDSKPAGAAPAGDLGRSASGKLD